ncbi:MAG: hypothetical protein HYZ09_01575 [Candidatus Kerfeldbacteria bacterium]|nr:hypothetical protein [Candidatus Kerfeldbacteria bacterium]
MNNVHPPSAARSAPALPTGRLFPALLLSAALIALVASCLRYVESNIAAARASDVTFDAHYVSRTLRAGALGSFGVLRTVVGVEGIRTKHDPAVSFVKQRPALLWVAPGQSTTITLYVMNRSLDTWPSSGPDAVTLRLHPDSPGALRHRWWNGDSVGRLKKPLPPGKTGALKFAVTGPADGEYVEETVELYAGEEKIPGGLYRFGSLVGATELRHLKAEPLDDLTLTLQPGQEIKVPITFTNLGQKTWANTGFGRVRFVPVNPGATNAFRSQSWTTASIVARLPSATVAAETSMTVALAIRAPLLIGTYTEDFQLIATNVAPIPGSQLRVTVTVALPELETVHFTDTEPLIRIGLMEQSSAPQATIRVLEGTAKLITTDGAVLLDPVSEVVFGRAGTQYTYAAGDVGGSTSLPLRVDAPATTVLEVVEYERQPSWDTTLNDNAFRGSIEWRADAQDDTWVINVLPIEAYVRGLAETSSTESLESRKTIITAARTYALHHWSKKTKHADEFYDINAVTDQVYRGFYHELRSPSVAEAVEATRGMVLFHDAAKRDLNPHGIILASYSACTDGRTRSFQEVWGGDGALTPYLVSVPDPDGICQTSRYRQGLDGNHMVGASGNGVRAMANGGKTYSDILTYYYTGVRLEKFYE